ncbi:MAG: TRAP transporter substrate-binding protein [Parasporobacterium sp.]|nr:TRAP transporter substrate-binding protein [Parasporobacterium sp.]
MRKMRKLFVMTIAAALVLVSLLGTTVMAAEGAIEPVEISGSYTIRLGTPTGGKHQQNVTMEKFKEDIEALSGGAITVELYPTSQLGTAPQMIEGVQNGDIEGVLIPSSYFASAAPAIAVLDVPFLFPADGTAAARAQEILAAGTSLDDYLYNKGFVVGGYLLGGNQYMLTTFEIKTVDDLKGKKMWTLPSKLLRESLELYGSQSVGLDPSDVATGLQNGTIDGVLNDCTFWKTQGLVDSAKCINLCPAGAFVNCFFFSADWIDTLPGEVRDLVLAVAKDVVNNFEVGYMTTYSQETLDTEVNDDGCTIYEPSEELLAAMKEATQPLHDEFKNTDGDCAAIYDEFVALIGE